MTVMQEFYCNECHGYFRVILNMDLNRTVVVAVSARTVGIGTTV